MQHDQFIGQVQHLARLPSRGEAERATRATLETLGERIPENVADNLASQLPREIGEHLRRTITLGGSGTGERFGLPEFVARVATRSSVDEPAAVYHARVVLDVVDEAVTPEMMEKVREALPTDLELLTEVGSGGDMDVPG